MIKKQIHIILLGTLLINIGTSCKKELDKIPKTKPVFTLNGEFNSQPMSLNAGNGDTVMSTKTWEWHSVPVLTGIIGNNSNYAQLDLFSGDIDLPTMNTLYANLTQLDGVYFPSGNFASLYKTQLENASSISEIKWELGDVNMHNDLFVAEPGTYDIDTKVTFNNGTNAEVSNDVMIGYKSHQLFKLETAVSNQYLTATITTESAISSIDWSFNGQTYTTTTKQVEKALIGVNNLISATVHFANGTSRKRTLVFDASGQGNYLSDYVYLIEKNLQQQAIDYKAKISVFVNGEMFVSSGVENQIDNMVSISKIEQYEDEITGKDAVKLTGKINAKFKNTKTNEIVNGKFDFVMAVPSKN